MQSYRQTRAKIEFGENIGRDRAATFSSQMFLLDRHFGHTYEGSRLTYNATLDIIEAALRPTDPNSKAEAELSINIVSSLNSLLISGIQDKTVVAIARLISRMRDPSLYSKGGPQFEETYEKAITNVLELSDIIWGVVTNDRSRLSYDSKSTADDFITELVDRIDPASTDLEIFKISPGYAADKHILAQLVNGITNGYEYEINARLIAGNDLLRKE